MPIFLTPGVKTRELDFSTYTSQISTCIVGIVGGATKGPIGVPTFCSSVPDFIRKFGEPPADDHAALAAIFFLNKGNQLWYTREAENTAAKSTASFAGTKGGSDGISQVETLTVVGTATTGGDITITVTAAGMAGSPKNVTVTVVQDDDSSTIAGKIRAALSSDSTVSAFFTVGGSGADVVLTAKTPAANDDTINIALAGGSTGIDDILTSTHTTAGVAPISGTIVNNVIKITFKEEGTEGNKYSAQITNAVGLDFTFSIYKDGVLYDSFKASALESSENYIVNHASTEFTFEVTLSDATAILNSDIVALTGGNNGLPLNKNTVIGTGVRGLKSFENPNNIDINILAAPGRSEAAVINELIRIAESRADCLPIIDPPQGLSPEDVVKWHNGTLGGPDDPGAALNTSYGALYYPWVKVNNPYSGNDEWVPPSTVVLGVFATNDSVAEPWYPAAGLNRGMLGEVLAVERDLQEGELGLLHGPGSGNMINAIINYKKQGFVVWGNLTLQRKTSATDRISVRRMLLMARKIIATSTAYMTFELNDSFTWKTWVGMVTPVFERIKTGRGLYDYKIVMDETTVTDDHIDRYEMPGQVWLKPTKDAEYILIDFILKPTGATFS